MVDWVDWDVRTVFVVLAASDVALMDATLREVESFRPDADEAEAGVPGSSDGLAVFVVALSKRIAPLKNPTPRQVNAATAATITAFRFMIPCVGRPSQHIERQGEFPAQSTLSYGVMPTHRNRGQLLCFVRSLRAR
jgi:hypothetical protein